MKNNMRKLTIKRDKTFVGCAMKAKVYLKDESGDVLIQGSKCRFVTTIKNNSSETFDIDENENIIYVIYDTLSKDYCFGKKVIPAGKDDVVIHGKPKFSPFKGNPFVFMD